MEKKGSFTRTFVLFGLVGFISFLSGGWLLHRSEGSRDRYERSALFRQVLERVAQYYVDDVSESELYDMAIDGMLHGMHDPYTAFVRRDDFDNLQLGTTGNYGGLGIRIEVRDGAITVITPIPDTPAEAAGIVAGDRIIEVDGESAIDWSSETAVARLTGEPGTHVNIAVQRAGYDELIDFTIERARIHVNSVSASIMVAPSVGYVQLTTVAETSAGEVASAVRELRSLGARSLIFDLRNNPGGLLDQGVALADLFLDRGDVVVETRGRAPGSSRVYRGESEGDFPDMPLVVLVNELSASAAEIIAGALQDQDRALLVGRTTFGKGVAQLVFRVGEREALKVTTSRWYTPLGRSINIVREGATGSPHPLPPPLGSIDSATTESQAPGDSPGELDTVARFVTPGGRELRGGGGIVPDVTVAADSIDESGRAFARALGADVQIFRDVMTALALEMKGEGTALDSNFVVTSGMRDELLLRLRARGVEISQADWRGAASLVDLQFGYELARYLFDRKLEMQRRASNDQDVTRALELLGHSADQADLFEAADSSQASVN